MILFAAEAQRGKMEQNHTIRNETSSASVCCYTGHIMILTPCC